MNLEDAPMGEKLKLIRLGGDGNAEAPKLPVTSAGRVRVGDAVRHQAVPWPEAIVIGTKRAPGRKPQRGENIVLVTEAGEIRVNSLAPVRVRRG